MRKAPRGQRYPLLLRCVLAVVAVSTPTAGACLCKLEAYRLCTRIQTARSATEARFYAERLCFGPERRCKLAVAMQLLGRGNDALDYVILEYLGWPIDVRRPDLRRWTRWTELSALLEDYLEVLVPELRRRSELARLYAQLIWRRLGISVWRWERWDAVAFATRWLRDLSSSADLGDADRLVELDAQARLILVCHLISREDVIPRITADNVAPLARELAQWVASNADYFRRDPEFPERVFLDRAANAAQQAVPEDARLTPRRVLFWGPPSHWRATVAVFYRYWLPRLH